jgi:hypothetical protein
MGPRILHIWNTAGVASVIAKFTDRLFGTKSSVITRRAADRVGLPSYGVAYEDGPAVFFARALLMAGRAEIVHVHSLDRIVPWLAALYPGKPTVMHYHGTDIQGRWSTKKARWDKAMFVAYSTPNLSEGAPGSAHCVPNPVDTDIFYPRQASREPRAALSFRYGLDEPAEELARVMSLELTLVDRWSVKHGEMPALLSKFSYYVDLRKPPGHPEAKSVGKAALEALSCGCKVIDWSGRTIEGLPAENDPNEVAKRWYEVYTQLLANRDSVRG